MNIKSTYFARTVELCRFESDQAIIFTFLVVVTGMDTSSKFDTVFIYTKIPIGIFFDKLNKSLKLELFNYRPVNWSSKFDLQTNLTITHRIVAVFASFKTIQFARTI